MTDTTTRRRKGPSLGSAIKQARKAGVVPTSATIAPDGSVSLKFGKSDDLENKAKDETAEELRTLI